MTSEIEALLKTETCAPTKLVDAFTLSVSTETFHTVGALVAFFKHAIPDNFEVSISSRSISFSSAIHDNKLVIKEK